MSFAAAAARATASSLRVLGDTSAALDAVLVTGIFDNGYGATPDGIASSNPTFMLPTAEVPHVTQDSLLRLIDGNVIYRVVNFEHDGTGATTLQLELQP